MFVPFEFLILKAAAVLGKKEVTSKEVAEYQSRYPIEYDSEGTLYFCTYKEDTYTLNDNIPPQVWAILTSI